MITACDILVQCMNLSFCNDMKAFISTSVLPLSTSCPSFSVALAPSLFPHSLPSFPQKEEINFPLKNNLGVITFWPWVEMLVIMRPACPTSVKRRWARQNLKWRVCRSPTDAQQGYSMQDWEGWKNMCPFAHVGAAITVAKTATISFIAW